MATPMDLRQAWLRYQVFIPPDRTEREIELKGENYLVRIYLYSDDPIALEKIIRVVYRFGPDLPYDVIETTDRRNNFDCKIFSSRSFMFEFQVYTSNASIPYGSTYEVNISRPDGRGYPISL